MSPFCQDFASLTDLRDEFIKYCPLTFEYGGVNGTVEDYDKTGNQMGPEKTITDEELLERVGKFVYDMVGASGSQVIPVVDIPSAQGTVATNNESTDNGGNKTNCNILMNHFRALVAIESTNDLFARVSDASAYLSGVTSVQGALGTERKENFLFGIWTYPNPKLSLRIGRLGL